MADEQLWPTPRYAEEIVFEGCARLVIAPEEYEALYNAHEALRWQLAARDAEVTRLRYLLSRYYREVPLGHQPHMIAHLAEAALKGEG